jgi:hypothetical protein
MTCPFVRRRLSEWIDGELESRLARQLESHLSSCPECAQLAEELQGVGRLLAALPRSQPAESVASLVLERIGMETETRRPGLMLLFRSFSAARPFILPSLVPAALVVAAALATVVTIDPGPLPEVHLAVGALHTTPASGTETNPLFRSGNVRLPREKTTMELPAELLERGGERSAFFETVVARDGSVADVTMIDGDTEGERALVNALRRQQFEPVRYRGRRVAVSVYRLISSMEVRSPLT